MMVTFDICAGNPGALQFLMQAYDMDMFKAEQGFQRMQRAGITGARLYMCNHYKRANTLETFRRYIAEIPRKLREDYIYKVGVAYGNIVENEKPIVFFFEKEGEAK